MFYIIVLLFLILFLISIMYRKKLEFNNSVTKSTNDYHDTPLKFYKDGTILYLDFKLTGFNPRGSGCYIAIKPNGLTAHNSIPNIWIQKYRDSERETQNIKLFAGFKKKVIQITILY